MPAKIRHKRGDEIVKTLDFETPITLARELAKLLLAYVLKIARLSDGKVDSEKSPIKASVASKIRKAFEALLKTSSRG